MNEYITDEKELNCALSKSTLFTKTTLSMFTRDNKNTMVSDQFRRGTHDLHTYPTCKGKLWGVFDGCIWNAVLYLDRVTRKLRVTRYYIRTC